MSTECFNCDIANGAVVLCPLHAAAAEMYEALRATRPWIVATVAGNRSRDHVDAALRHARGESVTGCMCGHCLNRECERGLPILFDRMRATWKDPDNLHKGGRPAWLKLPLDSGLWQVFYHLAKFGRALHDLADGDESKRPWALHYGADVCNLTYLVLDAAGYFEAHARDKS